MELVIRKGRAQDWDAILAVAHSAFKTCDGYFPRSWPHTYPGRCASRFVVCEDAGRIIGVINQTPCVLSVCGQKLKTAGIGSVGVLESERKRGIMSAMLKFSDEWQRRAGTDLGILGGDRLRYRNYGYEFGGAIVASNVGERQLGHVAPVKLRKLTGHDSAAVLRIYRRTPYALARTPLWQKLLIRSDRFTAFGNAGGALRAYFVVEGKDKVVEMAGATPLLPGMLRSHMLKAQVSGLSCHAVPGYAPHGDMLLSGNPSATAHVHFRIFDFGAFLEKMAGPLCERLARFGVKRPVRLVETESESGFDLLARGGRQKLKRAGTGGADIALDSASWVRVFFPPPGGPVAGDIDEVLLRALELPVHISYWDFV